MHTRITVIVATLFGVLLSGVACADDDRHGRRGHHRHHESHHHHHARPELVYAPVIYVEPLYRVVHRASPRRECWSTTDSYTSGGHDDSAAGMVLGGVLGGVLGHNVARGQDRDVATLVGTLLGASIGHDLGHTQAAAPVTRTRCRTTGTDEEVEQVIGYRVRYRYSGRIYETHTDHHPGARVQVNISIGD